MRKFEYLTVDPEAKTPEYSYVSSEHYSTNSVILDDHKEHIGDEMAGEYWDHCDGWESEWPLDFVIWEMIDEKPVFFARITVEMEMAPFFSATCK
jgi:hypothetical protein